MPELACSLSASGAFGLRVRARPDTMTPGPDDDEWQERHAEDARLVLRMARGDREAFAGLYDRFSRPLYTTALRILGDEREAEDVLQEIFLDLWRRAREFDRSRGSVFSWAVTLTRNRSIDRVRMRRRRGDLLARSAPEDLGYGSPADAATARLEDKEQAALVRAALQSLPEEQQQALHLAFFGGLTQQEIAERLAAPLGTVKARIRRGLLKLRDLVAPRP